MSLGPPEWKRKLIEEGKPLPTREDFFRATRERAEMFAQIAAAAEARKESERRKPKKKST